MPRKKNDDKTPPLSDPIPVRLKEETLAEAKTAMHRTKRSQQEVLRLAAEIGLAALAKIDYDVPGVVATFALEKAAQQNAGSIIQPVPPKYRDERQADSSAAASG